MTQVQLAVLNTLRGSEAGVTLVLDASYCTLSNLIIIIIILHILLHTSLYPSPHPLFTLTHDISNIIQEIDNQS